LFSVSFITISKAIKATESMPVESAILPTTDLSKAAWMLSLQTFNSIIAVKNTPKATANKAIIFLNIFFYSVYLVLYLLLCLCLKIGHSEIINASFFSGIICQIASVMKGIKG